MNTVELTRIITENAEEISRLHARIHETFLFRGKSVMKREEWQRACAEFHARYDILAFPGGYTNAFERIARGDADTIETALCFVECRPYFFRSGYMFIAILPKLKRATLTASQAERLNAVLLLRDQWRSAKKSKVGL
ncbi:MAG: hypothetical protein P4L91_03360 [Burkholderiaceae bacterium]|nr:hypothetical protein [Burkholderiaceae bacterium]